MRTQKGEKGQFLSNLMDGAEVHLTRIIQSGIDATFTILYDESLTIEQLVRFYASIEFMTIGSQQGMGIRHGRVSDTTSHIAQKKKVLIGKRYMIL